MTDDEVKVLAKRFLMMTLTTVTVGIAADWLSGITSPFAEKPTWTPPSAWPMSTRTVTLLLKCTVCNAELQMPLHAKEQQA